MDDADLLPPTDKRVDGIDFDPIHRAIEKTLGGTNYDGCICLYFRQDEGDAVSAHRQVFIKVGASATFNSVVASCFEAMTTLLFKVAGGEYVPRNRTKH